MAVCRGAHEHCCYFRSSYLGIVFQTIHCLEMLRHLLATAWRKEPHTTHRSKLMTCAEHALNLDQVRPAPDSIGNGILGVRDCAVLDELTNERRS